MTIQLAPRCQVARPSAGLLRSSSPPGRLQSCTQDVMVWENGTVVFIADDLGAWLIGLLADTGRKNLTALVLGTEQERAVRLVATAAVVRPPLDHVF